jgi:hypothetical protein
VNPDPSDRPLLVTSPPFACPNPNPAVWDISSLPACGRKSSTECTTMVVVGKIAPPPVRPIKIAALVLATMS